MDTGPAGRLVIAFCGTSCAGKTSLIRKTAELLEDAACLHFDDFRQSNVYPPDFATWVASGADPNEWRAPEFAAALRVLREGHPVSFPDGKGVVEPQRILLVEEPFGRSRREVAPSLNYVVYLDLPLDVAMVRKIRRDIQRYTAETGNADVTRWVNDFCATYLDGALRELYLAANERARAEADLILDAMRPLDDLASEMVRMIGELGDASAKC